MALYWHFKNKDELFLGIVDHVVASVKATRDSADPWQRQLRAMVESLVTVMRAHPCLTELLTLVEKHQAASFARATNDALELLSRAGFSLDEGYWVASYLMHGCVGLVAAQPGCPATMTPAQAAEWRRQKRLAFEHLPRSEYPMLVAFAPSLEVEPDIERYYRFGVDLLMGAITAAARPSANGAGGADGTV
jgi:AcrR family transcriptional regulator